MPRFLPLTFAGLLLACTVYSQETKIIIPSGHSARVTCAQYSHNGKLIATSHQDKKARIWDAATGKLLRVLSGHSGNVSTAFFDPKDKMIVTASVDSTARVWDAPTGKQLKILKGHNGMVTAAKFSPDGKKIVTASGDKTIKIWNVQSGKLLLTITGHQYLVHDISFSPDGKQLASASWDNTAKLWNTETGEFIKKIGDRNTGSGDTDDSFEYVQFSNDGKKVLAVAENARMYLADLDGSVPVKSMGGWGTPGIWYAQFSPDNTRIITAAGDNTAHIWDIQTEKIITTFSGHTDLVTYAQYSPDGKNILTSSFDSTCKVWDAVTGKLLYTFIAVDESDYLVTDINGHYDGTKAARLLAGYYCGSKFFRAESTAPRLWVHGLAEKILKNQTTDFAAQKDLKLCAEVK